MAGNLADVITCAKFQEDIFRGYNITGGRISHVPIDYCMSLTRVIVMAVDCVCSTLTTCLVLCSVDCVCSPLTLIPTPITLSVCV